MSQNRKNVSVIWHKTDGVRQVFSFSDLGLLFAKSASMKTVVSKVKRSGVYYLMTTVAPVNESRNARLDVWGAVAVVVLLLAVVGLMRLVLTA